MHADNAVICLDTVLHEWAKLHTQVISAVEEHLHCHSCIASVIRCDQTLLPLEYCNVMDSMAQYPPVTFKAVTIFLGCILLLVIYNYVISCHIFMIRCHPWIVAA